MFIAISIIAKVNAVFVIVNYAIIVINLAVRDAVISSLSALVVNVNTSLVELLLLIL